jgi:hypothetical protein
MREYIYIHTIKNPSYLARFHTSIEHKFIDFQDSSL